MLVAGRMQQQAAGRQGLRLTPGRRSPGQGCAVHGGGRAGSQEPEGEIAAARLLPDRSGLQRPGRLEAGGERHHRSNADVDRRPAHARGSSARWNSSSKDSRSSSPRVSTRRRRISTTSPSMFTDLTSGTETYPGGRYIESRSERIRHLRARLQPGVSTLTATTTKAMSARIRLRKTA